MLNLRTQWTFSNFSPQFHLSLWNTHNKIIVKLFLSALGIRIYLKIFLFLLSTNIFTIFFILVPQLMLHIDITLKVTLLFNFYLNIFKIDCVRVFILMWIFDTNTCKQINEWLLLSIINLFILYNCYFFYIKGKLYTLPNKKEKKILNKLGFYILNLYIWCN